MRVIHIEIYEIIYDWIYEWFLSVHQHKYKMLYSSYPQYNPIASTLLLDVPHMYYEAHTPNVPLHKNSY